MDAGEGYIQFIRELSIKCKKNDIVLSVDNYVPSSHIQHFIIIKSSPVLQIILSLWATMNIIKVLKKPVL